MLNNSHCPNSNQGQSSFSSSSSSHRKIGKRRGSKVHGTILLMVFLLVQISSLEGFVVERNKHPQQHYKSGLVQKQPSNNHNRHLFCLVTTTTTQRSLTSKNEEIIGEPDFGEDDLQVAGVVIEDLNWRVDKLRLEEANKRRFLKAKPRFLPYKDACDWVQAWGRRWTTAEDWENWIAMGEKRNSYIPSRPEEYYTRTGEWISWDHFLGVEPKDEPDESTDC